MIRPDDGDQLDMGSMWASESFVLMDGSDRFQINQNHMCQKKTLTLLHFFPPFPIVGRLSPSVALSPSLPLPHRQRRSFSPSPPVSQARHGYGESTTQCSDGGYGTETAKTTATVVPPPLPLPVGLDAEGEGTAAIGDDSSDAASRLRAGCTPTAHIGGLMLHESGMWSKLKLFATYIDRSPYINISSLYQYRLGWIEINPEGRGGD